MQFSITNRYIDKVSALVRREVEDYWILSISYIIKARILIKPLISLKRTFIRKSLWADKIRILLCRYIRMKQPIFIKLATHPFWINTTVLDHFIFQAKVAFQDSIKPLYLFLWHFLTTKFKYYSKSSLQNILVKQQINLF